MDGIELVDFQDLVSRIKNKSLKKFAETIMYGEGCHTKRGRINKSQICRKLGINSPQFDAKLKKLRAVFGIEPPPKPEAPKESKRGEPRWFQAIRNCTVQGVVRVAGEKFEAKPLAIISAHLHAGSIREIECPLSK